MESYCIKCKDKREMTETKEVLIDSLDGTEKKALAGKCSICGFNMFHILTTEKTTPALQRTFNKIGGGMKMSIKIIWWILMAIGFLTILRALIHFLIY